MNVALFGIGRCIDKIESLLQENVNILFYLDNNCEKQKELRKGKKIYSPNNVPNVSLDYVIISALHYETIERQLLERGGIRQNRLFLFLNKIYLLRSMVMFSKLYPACSIV